MKEIVLVERLVRRQEPTLSREEALRLVDDHRQGKRAKSTRLMEGLETMGGLPHTIFT
jgi:hypothetical protein